MNRLIVTEPAKCIGCRTCEIACVLAHERPSHDVRDIEALTATRFSPRLRLVRTLKISSPATCHHCEDAPCLNVCPSGAIFYGDDTVQVDQARCFGCKSCVAACPFGAMEMLTRPAYRSFAGVEILNGVKAEAHKCDLCIGRAQGPACVEVCPTDALHVMDAASTAEVRRRRQQRAVLDAGSIGATV